MQELHQVDKSYSKSDPNPYSTLTAKKQHSGAGTATQAAGTFEQAAGIAGRAKQTQQTYRGGNERSPQASGGPKCVNINVNNNKKIAEYGDECSEATPVPNKHQPRQHAEGLVASYVEDVTMGTQRDSISSSLKQ